MAFQQAVTLKDLRRYSEFERAIAARGQADDVVAYLRDDLTVHGRPFGSDSLLFGELSHAWVGFCRELCGASPALFQLHSLNEGFTWKETSGPLRILSQEQARSYDELGYTKLEAVFSREEIERVMVDMDECEARVESSLRRLRQGENFIARADEITFASHIVKRSAVVRDFVQSRPFQDIAHDLVGPDVRLYWDQTVYKKPGVSAPFPWHQDNGYTFVEPQQYPTIWIALTDTDQDNGCIWLAPRIHRLGTLAHERTELGYVCFDGEPHNAVPIEARAGDVVLFSSLTPHLTRGNFTDATRKAYILQLVPDGACSVVTDEAGKRSRLPVTLEERQFHILLDGREPAAMPRELLDYV
ncbi:MAG TPA: phytanoyl-CoA dioxygenase family protein [Polyangiaceae bacterium]|nr:phytanoyl-CoA dioxygenase family protein [Polyangiaceae bacterium]